MGQLNRLTRRLLMPPVLFTAIWVVGLILVVIGPINYPSLPSMSSFLLIAAGLALFSAAHCAGVWSFAHSLRHKPRRSAKPQLLNLAIGAASIVGLVGIALIALDRTVLSGMSNSDLTLLLRCAPHLVDFIQIKRTPLLYLGYLGFSFGFVSLALFVLKGECVKGWEAYAAQLSILCPVGYALLYSGRMPILLMFALIIAAIMVRLVWRLPPLPRGHYLLIKIIVISVLFGIYSNSLWSSRPSSCAEMQNVIQGLLIEKERRANSRQSVQREKLAGQPLPEAELPTPSPPPGIDAAAVTEMIEGVGPRTTAVEAPDVDAFLYNMRVSWLVAPRQYVLSALEAGYLPSSVFRGGLSSYFYLTHGVRSLDMIWKSRAQLSPAWGVYEIGVLSPMLRLFFPADQLVATMNSDLVKAGIYGFFPTAWGAALIDFGAWGAAIYIAIWGFCGGWAYCGVRFSTLVTPPLLLVFIIASIILSPVQGPLGISNSALVLISMLMIGGAIDLWAWQDRPRTDVPT